MTHETWWMIMNAVTIGVFSGLILFSGLLIAIVHDKCFRKVRRKLIKMLRNTLQADIKAVTEDEP